MINQLTTLNKSTPINWEFLVPFWLWGFSTLGDRSYHLQLWAQTRERCRDLINHRPHRIVCTPDVDSKKSQCFEHENMAIPTMHWWTSKHYTSWRTGSKSCVLRCFTCRPRLGLRLWRKHFRGEESFTSSPHVSWVFCFCISSPSNTTGLQTQ